MAAMDDGDLADSQKIVTELRCALEKRIAECDALRRELSSSAEQQAATADVLKIISNSPGDLATVFEAMIAKAARLCEADNGSVGTWDGDRFTWIALRGLAPRFAEYVANAGNEVSIGSRGGFARIARGEGYVQFADLSTSKAYRAGHPVIRALVDLAGARTTLSVPFAKDNVVLGVLAFMRREVRPFSVQQIELVRSFATQAVIAIENARLITETREALERQTATSEVLRVINGSPGNLAPVFDAILVKAHQLCSVAYGSLHLNGGERLHAVAVHGLPEQFADLLRRGYQASDHPVSRALLAGERLAHISDCAEIDHPVMRSAVELAGIRTALFVPLRRDETLLGIIVSARREVRPFTENEIAILEGFAAQAVIAIENARLINETRESLERQTATAEVLEIINSSPGNLAPVFDTILRKAHNLCDASLGSLQIYDGEKFRAVAVHGFSGPLADFLREGYRPGPNLPQRRLLEGASVAQIPDLMAVDDQAGRRVAELSGLRSLLCVALRKDGDLLGQITAARPEVRPFSDKEIALIESFAAQAVIAMENARLIAETREALEQQTATAEVLEVINSSPGQLEPVFGVMLEKAMRLCQAAFGFMTSYDGQRFTPVAQIGVPQALAAYFATGMDQPRPGDAHWRLLAGEDVVHNLDQKDEDAYRIGNRLRRATVDLGGARTALVVALRKDGALHGTFTIYRQEVRPFSDKQIALMQNFASQAVIAMENARLLGELRERQAELRVTFDNMFDGVVMFDAGLRLTAWNRNFQTILDVSDTLLAERPTYSDFVRILAERGEFGTEDVEGELSRRLQDTDREMRVERTRPDGRVIEVRRNAVPGGGFVLIYSDITDRKLAEQQIRAARDTAEAALRELESAQASLVHAQKMAALGQLTAGIAHEIKNPLNFVNNFAGLSIELLDELKETSAPAIAALADDRRAEVRETIEMLTGNLTKIAEHGRRADGIVKSMLAHSRDTSAERQLVDINELVEESLNLAYHGARAQDQSFNVTLERDFDTALAPIELVPQNITRVLLNLVGNGFYATNKRSQRSSDATFEPTVRVSTRDRGDAVEITVWDNGIGIAPENRDKLFQPFFTTKPTGEGTGLGLSISYEIVAQGHGGKIAVDSRPGEFTEFTVTLPRRARGR
jgi:PAS domain S-box-containing protein